MKSKQNVWLRIVALIILVLIVCVGVLFFFNNPEQRVIGDNDRKNSPGSYAALSQGVTHYELVGNDTAETVVLVHGFSVPYYIWDSTFSALLKKGYRVLRYDTYGRGYSDRPNVDYTAEVYDKQLGELLRSLNINTSIHLVGLSFGGPVASYFAAHHPEKIKTLSLFDPALNMGHSNVPEFMSYVLTVINAEKLSEQLSDFYHPEKFDGWNEKYKDQMQYKGFIHALVSTRYRYDGDIIASFQEIAKQKKPVLLVWGKEDNTTPFKDNVIVNEALHPRFIAVDDAAHLPHMEHPEVVNPVLLDFIREHSAQ